MAPQTIQQLQFFLTSFVPCFAQVRTFQYLVEFFWGIVCATARKTVTQIFIAAGSKRHYTNYHRFLKNYRKNVLDVARCLFTLIKSNIAPITGKVFTCYPGCATTQLLMSQRLKRKRGRPAIYGKKVKLKDLLNTETLYTLIANVGGKRDSVCDKRSSRKRFPSPCYQPAIEGVD